MGSLTASDQRVSPWLVWLWVLVILFCSSDIAGRWADVAYAFLFGSEGLPGGWLRPLMQKSFHVFLFASLGVLSSLPAGWRKPGVCIAICVAVSIGSEAFQGLWPSRSPSPADVLLNVVSGLAAYSWVVRNQAKRLAMARAAGA